MVAHATLTRHALPLGLLGLSCLLLQACEPFDRWWTSTPVRYEVCDGAGANCRVFARFRDFDSCHKHRTLNNSLCDWISRPGTFTCDTCPGYPEGCSHPAATSRCTK